ELRTQRYDVVYNLHGGTTATLLTRATGADHRVGFSHYRYARLHNHLAPPPTTLWERPVLHSVEQQLALIGWTGVPVTDRPMPRLPINDAGLRSAAEKLERADFNKFPHSGPFAIVHPTAAFDTKQWATEKFARVCEHLARHGLLPVAIVSAKERHV